MDIYWKCFGEFMKLEHSCISAVTRNEGKIVNSLLESRPITGKNYNTNPHKAP